LTTAHRCPGVVTPFAYSARTKGKDFMIINFKEPCSWCHHTTYLGSNGFDNEGGHLAYLCPTCGNETPDILPNVDDILPGNLAWNRDPDGTIHWHERVAHIPFNKTFRMIWCDRCQCFVSEKDLKRWTGDDALHHLCPGCDADLLPIEKLEE
jgi:hypothetical protein